MPLPKRHVQEIIYQLIDGMNCKSNGSFKVTELLSVHLIDLHLVGLVHCDLKPDNIALKRANSVVARQLEVGRGFCDVVSATYPSFGTDFDD